jgi:hypothetical protein
VEIRLPIKRLRPLKVNSSCLGYLYLTPVFHLNWDSSAQKRCIAWGGKLCLSVCLSETSCISTKTSWNTWANQQLNGQANNHISWALFDPRDRNIYQCAIDFKAGVLLDTEPMCGNLMLKITRVVWKIGFGFGYWCNRNNGLAFSPTFTSIRSINVEEYFTQSSSFLLSS